MASDDTLLIFRPQDNEPPDSNPALPAVRNFHPVLVFTNAANENAVLAAVMPQNFVGTIGVTVYLHFAMATDITNDIDLDVAFERLTDGGQDLDSDGFAAVQSVDGTVVPGTAGVLKVVSIAFTVGAQMDSVAKGDGFRIKVTRDAASDTSTDDMQLRFVEIRET